MAQEKVLSITKSNSTITTPYSIEANRIKSNSQIEVYDPSGVYGQRMATANGITYVQGGKVDRDVTDQRMSISGWYGTPLSDFRIMMAAGTQPKVRIEGASTYDILHRGNLPSAEDVKAMAIYDRPIDDDCDKAVMAGNYGIYANTKNTPLGTGPSGSTLLVTKWGQAGVNAQIFFSYTENRVWVRRQYIGVWQPWAEMYTSLNKQPVGGMGLGVGDSPNAITITGGVRDFNLLKTTGVFTIDGNWLNGTDNTTSATGHNGVVEVKQRFYDNFTIQEFTRQVNTSGMAQEIQFTRAWNNATDGWSPWVPSGTWESVNTYRNGILRLNNTTNDDSVYPYVSYTKEKYRDGVAAGTPYIIGEVTFRAGATNKYDPHTGDQLVRILGQAVNTSTVGEYDGRFRVIARKIRADGTSSDASVLDVSLDVGAEFTHGSKKVQINTGVVNAEKFVSTTSGYALQYANNSQQGVYFDNRTILGGGSSGVIIRPNGSGTPTGETVFGSDGTILNNTAPTTGSHLTNKTYVDKTVSGSLSAIIALKDTDDLDNMKTAGFYSQSANVKATSANHYPVGKAGNLQVMTSAGTIQVYYVYNSSEVWSRAQYSTGAWTKWERNYTKSEVDALLSQLRTDINEGMKQLTTVGSWPGV